MSHYAHLTFTELEIHIEVVQKQLDAAHEDDAFLIEQLENKLLALNDELNERREHLLK